MNFNASCHARDFFGALGPRVRWWFFNRRSPFLAPDLAQGYRISPLGQIQDPRKINQVEGVLYFDRRGPSNSKPSDAESQGMPSSEVLCTRGLTIALTKSFAACMPGGNGSSREVASAIIRDKAEPLGEAS